MSYFYEINQNTACTVRITVTAEIVIFIISYTARQKRSILRYGLSSDQDKNWSILEQADMKIDLCHM